jgi:hypothetical protein
MKPFEFKDSVKVKITPNQVHKMMDKLKSKVNHSRYDNYTDDFTSYSLSKAQNTDTSVDELVDYFKNRFMDNYTSQKQIFEFQKDLLLMKEALFTFNVTSGVSKKLSDIEVLRQEIEYYSLFAECSSCALDPKSILEKAKSYLDNSDGEVQNVQMSIKFYDYGEVKKLLKEARIKTLQLEKEITLLNATKDISVEISNTSAEYLGLG